MVLMYHNIGEQPAFNTVAFDAFTRQVEAVLQTHTAVGPHTYVDTLSQKSNHVLITFDDGYESFAQLAAPYLRSLNVPVLVFLPVYAVGGSSGWDAERGAAYPLMTWNTVRDLNTTSHVYFGSHGLSHRSLGDMEHTAVRDEMIHSKARMEDELGEPVDFFSFPFGQAQDIPANTDELLKTAGYKAAFTTLYGTQNKPAGRYRLKRIEIEPRDGLRRFRAKASHFSPFFAAKQAVKTAVFTARRP